MPAKKISATKKSYTDSFKVKLGSTTFVYTIPEMRQMMMAAFDEMEADGITHVKCCNLYVPPVDARGSPITRVKGRELEERAIPHPYRSAADEHGV